MERGSTGLSQSWGHNFTTIPLSLTALLSTPASMPLILTWISGCPLSWWTDSMKLINSLSFFSCYFSSEAHLSHAFWNPYWSLFYVYFWAIVVLYCLNSIFWNMIPLPRTSIFFGGGVISCLFRLPLFTVSCLSFPWH